MSTFLDKLPAEVRLNIYAHTLHHKHPVTWQSEDVSRPPANVGVLAVSKQVRSEAVAVFFQVNCVRQGLNTIIELFGASAQTPTSHDDSTNSVRQAVGKNFCRYVGALIVDATGSSGDGPFEEVTNVMEKLSVDVCPKLQSVTLLMQDDWSEIERIPLAVQGMWESLSAVGVGVYGAEASAKRPSLILQYEPLHETWLHLASLQPEQLAVDQVFNPRIDGERMEHTKAVKLWLQPYYEALRHSNKAQI